jgi:hypothetical protein
MQYFKPDGPFFVGDCMPFFHDGVFRFFYLLDEGHHQGLSGLGGHQWAQASTRDLTGWTHHPLAIPITDEREGSICTGSTFFHEGTFYGFYATRMRDRSEHLSLAVSPDGVLFTKTEPNPFWSPSPGFRPNAWRDPVVFRNPDTGRFHLLVTAEKEDFAMADRGGVLAHLESDDLRQWTLREPFLRPGLHGAPECPDYFFWNGWYYLVFSNRGVARYRMSRHPLGPWARPRVDTLDAPALRVMKTAAFHGNRRLGVAWLPWRRDERDDGVFQFGGNAVFREFIQQTDGSLTVTVPPELIPASGVPVSLAPPKALTGGVTVGADHVMIDERQSLGVASCAGIPRHARIGLRVTPQPDSACFGVRLGARKKTETSFEGGYDLSFSPFERAATLQDQALADVDGLDRPFTLDILLKDDIVDVVIDNRRTLIDRCPQRSGDAILLFARNGAVRFDELSVRPLL